MGDMEDYEARMCARDAFIDQYEYWLAEFQGADEPRQSLVSWKQFSIVCWRCDDAGLVVKVGQLSYELDCGHLADRAVVDFREAEHQKFLDQLHGVDDYYRYTYDCPVHLVRVSIREVYGNQFDYSDGPVTYNLGCGCLITEAPDRMECYQCPLIDGVAVPMPRVIGRGGIIEAHRDPTCTYQLECGHITF